MSSGVRSRCRYSAATACSAAVCTARLPRNATRSTGTGSESAAAAAADRHRANAMPLMRRINRRGAFIQRYYLKILGDALKFLDQFPELARQRLGSLFHAMMDVVLDEF